MKKKSLKDIPELSSYLTEPNKFINGEKPSKATEIYVVGDSGKTVLANLSLAVNVKFKELEAEEKEKRLFAALKSLADYYDESETAEKYFAKTFPKEKKRK
ncbi:MAG: hypothetical protein V9F01_08030 [Chitinophagaceae bacterium]